MKSIITFGTSKSETARLILGRARRPEGAPLGRGRKKG